MKYIICKDIQKQLSVYTHTQVMSTGITTEGSMLKELRAPVFIYGFLSIPSNA
jgi:hypothetical protein